MHTLKSSTDNRLTVSLHGSAITDMAVDRPGDGAYARLSLGPLHVYFDSVDQLRDFARQVTEMLTEAETRLAANPGLAYAIVSVSDLADPTDTVQVAS